MKIFTPRDSDNIPMADLAHAWTFSDTAQTSKALYQVQTRYRHLLRQAHRFILDDDSVRLCCSLSQERDRMEGWSFLARLPYDTMFIELNLHEKVKELARLDRLDSPIQLNMISPRLGILLHRDDVLSDSPRWVAIMFYLYREKGPDVLPGVAFGTEGRSMISPDMVAFVFDPEGNPKFPTRGSKAWNAPTLSLRPGFPATTINIGKDNEGHDVIVEIDPEILIGGLLSTGGGPRHKELHHDAPTGYRALLGPDNKVYVNSKGVVEGPEWLTPRVGVLVDPWWDTYFAERWKTEPAEAGKLIQIQLMEERGSLRYIITLLAAINGLPKVVKPRAVSTRRHTVGMNQLQYFGHSDLSIQIPGEDRLLLAKQHLDKTLHNDPRRRRGHEVRGHWRVIEFGKRIYYCRHDPVEMEPNLGICRKCDLIVRWIPSHTRGDATLGWVEHDYHVTTR